MTAETKAGAMDPEGLRAVEALFQQQIDEGLHPGASLAVYHHGRLVLELFGGLARFYTMLAAGGTLDGVRILSPESVERATAVQVEVERDRSLGIPMRWALGFHLGGNRVDLFGHDTSPRAFGHGGHGSCVGWADPDVGLAVAIITNGLRSPAGHALRVAALSAAIRKACL